jgi:ATP-dependent DNA ligase
MTSCAAVGTRCSTRSTLDGEDLRSLALIERKERLRELIPEQPSVLLYGTHVERCGRKFLRAVCEQDLEGIVAKLRHGVYGEGWYKIRNPQYSQYEGRHELFEKRQATHD